MRSNQILFVLSVMALMLAVSCSKDDPGPKPISILSITMNGASLANGAINIPTEASLAITFSAALQPADFESALSINSNAGSPNGNAVYSNQSSKVTVELALAPQTAYTVSIGTGPIGQNGERLEEAFSISFTTADDGIITSLPACTTGNNDCLQTISLTEDGTGSFEFYSSFPIYEENAAWENLRAAIIVVHGVNRNANDYFNYMMATLQSGGLENEAVLIAPFFKEDTEAAAGDYYWGSNGWREGRNSASSAKISSFAVVDQLIDQLADENRFPALEKIIVTGHSSGALFTHLYAAANQAEGKHAGLTFEYVAANSQYYYYPDGRRINENTGQLYTPTGCTGYDFWPLGYQLAPPYLGAISASEFNGRFISRAVTYLLGNGTGPDGALNTTDCFATLLGSTRYARGENMYRYMELVYAGTHQHSRVIVEGVGHDGLGMYRSPEFTGLLESLLE